MKHLRIRIHQPTLLTICFVVALLGMFFIAVGLDDADKYSSVIGGLFTVAGSIPPLMAWIRRPSKNISPSSEKTPSTGQHVRRSSISGDSLQVRGVHDSIRIGPTSTRQISEDRPSPKNPVPPSASPGAQSVTDSTIKGSSIQIDQVSGDVDIQRKM